MVTDRLTDIVYFSEWALKDFPVPINNIVLILCKNNETCLFKTVWDELILS